MLYVNYLNKAVEKATEKISWSPLEAGRVTLCVKALERPECWALTTEWGQKEGEAMKTVGRREGGRSRKERIIVLWLLQRGCQTPASNIRESGEQRTQVCLRKVDSQQVSSKLSTLLLCREGHSRGLGGETRRASYSFQNHEWHWWVDTATLRFALCAS